MARRTISRHCPRGDGFLWLGTHSGLVRFDGLRFEPLRARQGAFPDTVTWPSSAADGGMWWAGSGGISHVKDGVVRNYGGRRACGPVPSGFCHRRHGRRVGRRRGRGVALRRPALAGDGAGAGLHGAKGLAVFADRGGKLGVFSEQGLFLWQPGQARFAPPVGHLDLRAPPQQGPDGRLYLLELRGIRIIDTLERYDQLDHRWIYRDTSGTSGSMLVDRQGTLWFDSQFGLHRTRSAGALESPQLGISGGTESFLPRDGLSNVLIGSLCDDNEGNVWVATYSGLYRFRQAAPVILSARAGPEAPETFRAQQLSPGTGGRMWLSREGDTPLMLAAPDGKVLRAPALGPVTAIMAAPGGIRVGTRAGLLRLDGDDGRVLETIAYPPEAAALNGAHGRERARRQPVGDFQRRRRCFQYADGAWRREPALPEAGARCRWRCWPMLPAACGCPIRTAAWRCWTAGAGQLRSRTGPGPGQGARAARDGRPAAGGRPAWPGAVARWALRAAARRGARRFRWRGWHAARA